MIKKITHAEMITYPAQTTPLSPHIKKNITDRFLNLMDEALQKLYTCDDDKQQMHYETVCRLSWFLRSL